MQNRHDLDGIKERTRANGSKSLKDSSALGFTALL